MIGGLIYIRKQEKQQWRSCFNEEEDKIKEYWYYYKIGLYGYYSGLF